MLLNIKLANRNGLTLSSLQMTQYNGWNSPLSVERVNVINADNFDEDVGSVKSKVHYNEVRE